MKTKDRHSLNPHPAAIPPANFGYVFMLPRELRCHRRGHPYAIANVIPRAHTLLGAPLGHLA
jgi:hypothetical protein